MCSGYSCQEEPGFNLIPQGVIPSAHGLNHILLHPPHIPDLLLAQSSPLKGGTVRANSKGLTGSCKRKAVPGAPTVISTKMGAAEPPLDLALRRVNPRPAVFLLKEKGVHTSSSGSMGYTSWPGTLLHILEKRFAASQGELSGDGCGPKPPNPQLHAFLVLYICILLGSEQTRNGKPVCGPPLSPLPYMTSQAWSLIRQMPCK